MENEDIIFMADCNCNVNVFILVSINRTLATPTAKAALHIATAWKPFRDSICLYARHQVQSELGGGILVNGHTEYLVAEGKSHWPRDSPVIQVRNLPDFLFPYSVTLRDYSSWLRRLVAVLIALHALQLPDLPLVHAVTQSRLGIIRILTLPLSWPWSQATNLGS